MQKPPALDSGSRQRVSQRKRARSAVLLVGMEPWGAIAARELGASGVAVDVAGEGHLEGGDLVIAGGPWDLLISCLPAADLRLAQAVARFAQARNLASLTATLEGPDAVVGPLVIPGRTACWDCARRRRLAHAPRPRAARALHEALIAGGAPRRVLPYPRAAVRALGDLLIAAARDALASPGTANLAGRLGVLGLRDLGLSIHTVLPMPECGICGGAEKLPPRGDARPLDGSMSPAELRERLAGVVDARTGIVAKLDIANQDTPYAVDLPITAHATLGAYSTCTIHDHEAEPEDGSGKGLTPTLALIGAVGEAVERYSAGRVDRRSIVRAPAAALGEDAIAVDRLTLYSEEQYAEPGFPYQRVDPAEPLDWALGRWLDTGRPVRVPAVVSYYGYPAPPGEQLCQVTSNGLAAGPSFEDACRRAALELVERDAFTLSWLARRPGTRVRLDASVSAGVREVARRLVVEAGPGGRLSLYHLDVGLRIPTILCALFGDGVRWPGASIALASHLRPRRAIEKAILEQAQAGFYYRRLLEEKKLAIPERAEDVHTLEDHALYYFPPDRAGALSFLDGGESVSAGDLPEPEEDSLALVVTRLSEAGLRVAVIDVTSPDLRGTPFFVVRAVGPDFQPIHFGHGEARLGNPRLHALTASAPNPDPHPMD